MTIGSFVTQGLFPADVRGQGEQGADLPRALGRRVRLLFDEMSELGTSRTLVRLAHEVQVRSPLAQWNERSMQAPGVLLQGLSPTRSWHSAVPTADPRAVREAMVERIGPAARASLRTQADDAARGRIRCFSRWTADFGSPIDWHLNPRTGQRWNPQAHWSRALDDEARVGDVKHTWEAARFPQAYLFARAGALDGEAIDERANAFASQVQGFLTANPFPNGIHWYSGQEITLRLIAWSFAGATFSQLGATDALAPLTREIARYAATAGQHLEGHLAFVRSIIYNNHLLSDTLGLYVAARMLPPSETGARWTRIALADLDEQADRQVYRDGAYIQDALNYHRVGMQYYLWASILRRHDTGRIPDLWLRAMERSLEFLLAQQNPANGWLPNHGNNDGALPLVLSTCDLPDFRPLLQTLSLLTRGERVYAPGPWDEEAAWLLGPEALKAPLREPTRRSVSFAFTGHHVLRGRDQMTFGAFRCGSLRDRFAQMDMLQLSVFWRGHEILTDPGSYQYNAADRWQHHFISTAAHNTVSVDGRDQMLHIRRFKCLYPTRANLVVFENTEEHTLCRGEHYGYQRDGLGVIHQRTVLFEKDDLWIVVDHVTGPGEHEARLHWLCAPLPYEQPAPHRVVLAVGAESFSLSVFDAEGRPAACSVVAGSSEPPRGWQSRYYGEKVPVPSIATEYRGELPHTWVTVMGAGVADVQVDGERWTVRAGDSSSTFKIRDGVIERS